MKWIRLCKTMIMYGAHPVVSTIEASASTVIRKQLIQCGHKGSLPRRGDIDVGL